MEEGSEKRKKAAGRRKDYKVMDDNQYTVDEHFIPQVYLRGFSPDYYPGKKHSKNDKSFIWRCDLSEKKGTLVPIDSQCFEKNLYEFRGYDNEIPPCLRNYLEKVLGHLEDRFGEYRSKLEHRAYNESNISINCFFSSEEKDFYVLFITLQILRYPDVLKCAAEFINKVIDEPISERQARNNALKMCLPFMEKIDENTKEAALLKAFYSPMRELNFTLFVDRENGFVTGERNVYVEGITYEDRDIEYEMVVFPITSSLCLILIPSKSKRRRNHMFYADDRVRKEVIGRFAERNGILYANRNLLEEIQI